MYITIGFAIVSGHGWQNKLSENIQGSNFSAPERSSLVIFEISVNVVRKYFAYGGDNRGKNDLKSAPEAFAYLEP